MAGLIDIGANLTHESFSTDLAEVIARAQGAGVLRLIATGASVAGSAAALRIAREYRGTVFATAGIHPHHATAYGPGTPAELEGLATNPEVVAIGECGLDYFRNFSPHAAQRAAFAGQLASAIHLRKPVFLHQRDAHADFLAILREHSGELAGGVAHCFTGSGDEMASYLELGLHIGITGWICDERRGQPLREAVRDLPLERVLLETDAPYLLPRDLVPQPKTRRNEPAFLPHVLLSTAAFMKQDPAVLAAAAWRNTVHLFALGDAGT